MAGHSQFKNIMHRKGAQDKKRSKLFNKLGREIMVAAKSGQPNPDINPRLRAAIQAARSANMPNDRIKRAIESGSPNSADAANYDEVRYEGYGPGGVAVIVEALTDNRNRTAAEIRAAFAKKGGALGELNSVSFMFDRIGAIVYPASVGGVEQVFEAAVEAGAENVESDKDGHEIATKPEDFMAVKDALVEKFGEPETSGITWKPKTITELDHEKASDLFVMIDLLEDSDDVQNVFSNFEVTDEVMERLMAS